MDRVSVRLIKLLWPVQSHGKFRIRVWVGGCSFTIYQFINPNQKWLMYLNLVAQSYADGDLIGRLGLIDCSMHWVTSLRNSTAAIACVVLHFGQSRRICLNAKLMRTEFCFCTTARSARVFV